jgi:hypothetical protein
MTERSRFTAVSTFSHMEFLSCSGSKQ